MAYYRSGTQKPLEAGNGIDITDETISLKQASTTEFGAAKIDGTSISVNANGQIKKLKTQTVTLSASTSEITAGSTDVITATASAGGTLSVQSFDSTVATATISNGTITVTGVGGGTATITVTASATDDYMSATATIAITCVAIHVYGAEWDGSSDPSWTRTDDAVGFSDPNPYYAGMSGSPSSPFDNIMPWSGMRIVEDSEAGTLVEIPKFWYKWTRNGSAMKLQISDGEQTSEGWHVSPAHADRGDGVGERDYVYVGRYHCSGNSSSYCKSDSGVGPYISVSRAGFRYYIGQLGTTVWQWDFAMLWTIRILYLVEFAHWNSQLKIGYGCGNDSYSELSGITNSLPYHTGTNASARTSYGHIQYRYVEDLWANVYDWVDGIYFSSTAIYCIKNPANFSDDSRGTRVGTRPTSSVGCITTWTDPSSVTDFEYALYPSAGSGTDYSTYVCDDSSNNLYDGVVLEVGSSFGHSLATGLFYSSASASADRTSSSTGSRLMVLPPSRLSPPTD